MACDGVGRKFGNLPAIHCALRKRTNRNKALLYLSKKVDNELSLLLDKRLEAQGQPKTLFFNWLFREGANYIAYKFL